VAHCQATVDILGSGRRASPSLGKLRDLTFENHLFWATTYQTPVASCAGRKPVFSPFSQRSEADFGVPGMKREARAGAEVMGEAFLHSELLRVDKSDRKGGAFRRVSRPRCILPVELLCLRVPLA
jgi:hypothetical protein